MEKKYKKLFSNTIIFAIGNFGSKILTFLLVPLYTSLLSTEQYGTADLVTTTVSLLFPILTLSIYEATLRFSLDKKYSPNSVLNNSLIITLLGALALLLFTPLGLLIDWHLREYWWYIIVIFISVAFQGCLSNYLKGIEKTKLFAIQGIVYTITYLLSNIVLLVFLKKGIEGYLVSVIIGYAASNVFMILFGKIYKVINVHSLNKELLKEMLHYSIPLAPTAILWWINASSDKYMLLWIIGSSANGLYTVASKIPTIFTTFSNLFSQAWRISAISNYNDEEGKYEFYSKIYRYYYLFSIYSCIVLTGFSQLMALILFKNDYYSAWQLVPMLLFAALMEGLSGLLASVYAAAKKTKLLTISTCIGAVFNIILNYFLIKEIGIIGAPIATALSFVVIWIIRTIVLERFFNMNVNYYKMGFSLLLTFASFIIFSYDIKYKYVSLIIVFLIITFMYYYDIKMLFVEGIELIKRKRDKKND